MQVALRELLAWTAAHHNSITAQVLQSLGVTVDQRKRLVAEGVIERVIDGSYRFAGGPVTELSRCVAVSARRTPLVVCGPTAGRIWGLRRMPDDGLVHVIAPPGSQPCVVEWVRPYRTATLQPNDIVTTPEGIKLTSPPRTAIDLSRHLDAPDLRSVIDQLIAEQFCTAFTMRRLAEPIATPGRPWARRFLAELDKLPGGGAAESHDESRVVAALVAGGVEGLEGQHWLRIPEFHPIRLDAAVPAIRWGVEIDGHPDHFTESGVSGDLQRDYACRRAGWQVNRATRKMLRDDFDGTVDLLLAEYHRCRLELAGRGTSSPR